MNHEPVQSISVIASEARQSMTAFFDDGSPRFVRDYESEAGSELYMNHEPWGGYAVRFCCWGSCRGHCASDGTQAKRNR